MILRSAAGRAFHLPVSENEKLRLPEVLVLIVGATITHQGMLNGE